MFETLIETHDKMAVSYGDKSYSYDELLKYIHLYANYYEATLPNQKIDKVMLFSKNTSDYIFAIYGALRIKSITVPVDAQSTPHDLTYMINDSRPEIIYTEPEQMVFVEQCVAEVGDPTYQPHIFNSMMVDDSKVMELSADSVTRGDMEDVMTIIYTSGTTGSPKGVMLTYSNLWYNVNAVTNDNKILSGHCRSLMILPINHIFCYAGGLLAPLYSGGQIYIAESLTAECILSNLKKGRITVMLGVPRLYESFAKGIMAKINSSIVTKVLYKMCAALNSGWLSKRIFKKVHDMFGGQMEFFVSGGAALPIETGNTFKALGLYVLEGYGMTECAPMIAFTRPGERAVGYCGRILKGCEYRIGENEEVLVRGANVMKGYYQREEETAAVIRDGWLHTGDTATYDPKLGMKITGRIKEIIVTPNGKNINPALIENEITQCSLIIKEIAILLYEGILQAIVYPDMNAVRADTKSNLDDLVRGEIEEYNRTAAGYKRIMRYHIISEELPKTRLGKTQRFKLEEYIGERKAVEREDVTSRSECFKALKAVVDEQTGVYANGDSHFEIDLALDSLGRISLLAFVEEKFGVEIAESDLAEMPTLNKLSEYVESKMEGGEVAENLDSNTNWAEILSQASSESKIVKSGFVHRVSSAIISFGLNFVYRIHTEGQELIPKTPVLFVCNHRSGFDGAFVTARMKWSIVRNSYFFAKDKHFDGAFKEFMASHNNIILMNINSNVKESMQQMYRYLSEGGNIIIFPEGTRYKDGVTRSFKESFAILSSILNIPVIPVAINGSEAATKGRMQIPQFGKRIEVTFLNQMSIREGETTKEFAARVEGTIVHHLK